MISERYSYDVFGKPTIRDVNNSVVSVSSVANRYMFTGREYDAETGNYYYRARYYSPKLGRFLQTDPIRYLTGFNLYTYCDNNPVKYKDPTGLLFENFGDPVRLGENYNNAVGYWEFVVHAGGHTLSELQHEIDQGQASDSSAGGPATSYRYVIDPATNIDVIDMRHFLVVGPQGELTGLGIELYQLLTGSPSGWNAQDFLSNKLGKDFYENYYLKYKDRYPLDVLLNWFFQDRAMAILRERIEKKKGNRI